MESIDLSSGAGVRGPQSPVVEPQHQSSQRANGVEARRRMPPSSRLRSKAWVFTLFEQNGDLAAYQEVFRGLSHGLNPFVSYGILGFETCPSTGRRHLQGYVYCSSRVGFRSFQGKMGLPRSCHVEKANGTPSQNKEYCSKEGDFFEIGDFAECPVHNSRAGGSKKSASQRVHELWKRTRRIRDAFNQPANEALSYNSIRLMEMYAKYDDPRPVSPDTLEVTAIFGPSGSGKSRFVDTVTDGQAYRPISYKWWEGYDGDRAVVFDDIRGDFCKFHELLKVLDIYPFRVETKGGSRQLQARSIFLTAPRSPVLLWGERTNEELFQLERRIHNVIEFVLGEPPEEGVEYVRIPDVTDSYAIVHKGSLPVKEHVLRRLEEDQVVEEANEGN